MSCHCHLLPPLVAVLGSRMYSIIYDQSREEEEIRGRKFRVGGVI